MTVVVFLRPVDNVLGNFFVEGGGGYGSTFTLAFCVSTWATLLAAKYYAIDIFPDPTPSGGQGPEFNEKLASGVSILIKGSGNPAPEEIKGFKWTPWEFIKAVLNGVSQVTFIENWKTGLFWVIGLTLSFTLVSGNLFANAYTLNLDASIIPVPGRGDRPHRLGNRGDFLHPGSISASRDTVWATRVQSGPGDDGGSPRSCPWVGSPSSTRYLRPLSAPSWLCLRSRTSSDAGVCLA